LSRTVNKNQTSKDNTRLLRKIEERLYARYHSKFLKISTEGDIASLFLSLCREYADRHAILDRERGRRRRREEKKKKKKREEEEDDEGRH